MCFINAQELKAAAGVTSKDLSRPILNSVYVEIENDEYTIAGTDSYVAFMVNRRELSNPTKYLLESAPLSHLKASDWKVNIEAFDDEHVKATIYGRHLDRLRDEIWPLSSCESSKYPKIRSLFDDSNEPNNGSFGIDANLCEKMCRAIRTAAKNNALRDQSGTSYVKVESVSPMKPIRFTSTKNPDIEGIVMPVRLG